MLERHGAPTHTWPTGYLLSSNALLAGDADRAIRYRRLLPAPGDPQWAAADRWLDGAVDRLERLRPGRRIRATPT